MSRTFADIVQETERRMRVRRAEFIDGMPDKNAMDAACSIVTDYQDKETFQLIHEARRATQEEHIMMRYLSRFGYGLNTATRMATLLVTIRDRR